MGKASSSKKIRRVQQAGVSRAPGQRRNLAYPALIVGIIVVGTLLVFLTVYFLVPPFLLRWRFGRPNRPGRDYDALVQRYQEKLAAGGRAPSRFVPKNVAVAEIPAMASAIMQYADRIARKASRWSDRRIDRYLVPHPLLGKITLRELFYFTIYHAQHHQALIERDLAAQGRSESPT